LYAAFQILIKVRMPCFLSLTPEILNRIIRFLRVEDKKNVMLVSTYMKKITKNPLLWKKDIFTQPVGSFNSLYFLRINRFSLISHFDLSGFNLGLNKKDNINLLLMYLKNNSKLQSINLYGNDLSNLPVYPFCEEMSRCKNINLSKTNLKMEQLVSILETIIKSKYTVNLDLSNNDMKLIKGSLLGNSLKKLRKVNFSNCNLSKVLSDQIEEIIENLTNSRIIEADLSGSDMSNVAFDNLGLNQNLSILKLREVSFNPELINFIFINISLISNLSHLDLSNSVLTKVEPILLSDSVTKVFHVNISHCALGGEHIEFMLGSIDDQSQIKQLLLSGNNCIDISPEFMLNALKLLDIFQF